MKTKLTHPIRFWLFTCLSFACFCITTNASALPVCQLLDRSSSKLDLTLDIFGNTKKTKIDDIKAFLWIDPENPESARLSAVMRPKISKVLGNFEDNPLMIGMLSNLLDQELIFRSQSVLASKNDNFHVTGKVTTGVKNFPADFMISSKGVSKNLSRFVAKVQSDNFQQVLGTPGSAKGDFELVFKTQAGLLQEQCRL